MVIVIVMSSLRSNTKASHNIFTDLWFCSANNPAEKHVIKWKSLATLEMPAVIGKIILTQYVALEISSLEFFKIDQCISAESLKFTLNVLKMDDDATF